MKLAAGVAQAVELAMNSETGGGVGVVVVAAAD
jgi:hypothetical protein